MKRRDLFIGTSALLAVSACTRSTMRADAPPCAFKAPATFLNELKLVSNTTAQLRNGSFWSLLKSRRASNNKVKRDTLRVPQRELKRMSQKDLKRMSQEQQAREIERAVERMLDEVEPQLALFQEYLWDRRAISVSFLSSVSDAFARKVMAAANEWAPFAGIQFTLAQSPPSDVRVELVQDNRNWSRFGTEALEYTDQSVATMHFGGITEFSGDGAVHAMAVHEFGHALGAIHEHQSPAADIQWNIPVVSDYYENELGWQPQDVIANILSVPAAGTTLYQQFDPLSIMIYAFPARFTLNGFSVNANTSMSDLDRRGMKELYDQFRKANGIP